MRRHSPQLRLALDSQQLTPLTGPERALDDYANFLDLPYGAAVLSERLGGLVLDVGSGYEYFGRALSAQTSTRVVSLNPKLLDEPFRTDIAERWAEDPAANATARMSVAGLVQALPFKDNTFDSVVSLFSFPTIFDEQAVKKGHSKPEPLPPAEYAPSYQEIVRVLKPGGAAFLGPVWYPGVSAQALQAVSNIIASYEFVDPPAGSLSALHITKTA